MRWRRCSASMTIGHGGHSCARASYCRDLQLSGSSGRSRVTGPGRAGGSLHPGGRRPMPLTRCHYAHYKGLSGQKGGYFYGCRSRVESFLFSSLEYKDFVHIHPSITWSWLLTDCPGTYVRSRQELFKRFHCTALFSGMEAARGCSS